MIIIRLFRNTKNQSFYCTAMYRRFDQGSNCNVTSLSSCLRSFFAQIMTCRDFLTRTTCPDRCQLLLQPSDTSVHSTSLLTLFPISLFDSGIYIAWTGPNIDSISMCPVFTYLLDLICYLASQHTCLYEQCYHVHFSKSTTTQPSSHQ